MPKNPFPYIGPPKEKPTDFEPNVTYRFDPPQAFPAKMEGGTEMCEVTFAEGVCQSYRHDERDFRFSGRSIQAPDGNLFFFYVPADIFERCSVNYGED